MKPQVLLRCAALAALAFAGAAYAEGGRVLESDDASVVRSRSAMPAERGTVIQPGDEIQTGKSGGVKWWMEDDALYQLAPNSQFRIEEFVVPRQQGNTPGRWIARLVKGGFRAVSGLIGKNAKDTYEVRTEVATMGIRGTAWASFLCEGGACVATGKKGAKKLANGLYVRVGQGMVIVANDRGRVETPAGSIAFVASALVAPIIVQEAPDILLSIDIEITPGLLLEPERVEFECSVSPSTPNCR